MNARPRVIAFLVQKIGPYHHARLQALAAKKKFDIHVLEFRPVDPVYAWDPVDGTADYRRHALTSTARVGAALGAIRPDATVCVGYSDPEVHRAATWSMDNGVALVTCSDSTYDDERRTAPKEAMKRLVVAAFDSALVAGSRAHDYLGRLGVNGASRFRPWDVVDNAHFERWADEARRRESDIRQAIRLPARYFICVARFVAKKNLGFLLDAYAAYAARAGRGAWSLVLSGAGPLEAELRKKIRALAIGERVFLPGFVQYGELPALYGLGGALVLPSVSDQWGLVVNEAMASGLPVLVSSRCGCTPDLVRPGENGFLFDPSDFEETVGALERIANLPANQLAAMGRCSRSIVAAYSPRDFAIGLESAIDFALARPARRGRWATRLLLRVLARRPMR
jgi:glycosyltransferase involved in cell wall biosynthesis